MILYQLVATGPNWLGSRQRVHSRMVYRSVAEAEQHYNDFSRKCTEETNGIGALLTVEEIHLVMLELEDDNV